MPTVYFDTSFFLHLRDATEEEAATALGVLNRLGVRHVLSDVIHRDLATSKASDQSQRRLLDRVLRLRVQPLVIGSASWPIICAPIALRRQYVDAYGEIDKHGAVAKSLSLAAGQGMELDEIKRLLRSNPDLPPGEWLQADGALDIAKMKKYVNGFLRQFGVDLSIHNPSEATAIVDAKLRQRFGNEIVDNVEEHRQIAESALRSSQQSQRHVSQMLSDKRAKKLANTYRDVDHMTLFVQHQEEIDLLQIDHKQMRLAESNAQHRLRQLQLLDRCFAADTLQEVVTEVESRLDT